MLWNLIFAVYESVTTIPEDLQLASRQFGLRGYIQWTRVVLPAVIHKLAYNSMISWANGWSRRSRSRPGSTIGSYA